MIPNVIAIDFKGKKKKKNSERSYMNSIYQFSIIKEKKNN